MVRHLLLSIISTLFTLTCFSQDPCKSYPMNGYTGSCKITTLMSADGKYVYTSDMVSLKKWDVATNKVVEEITPFPDALEGITSDPKILRTSNEKQNLYNLTLKSGVSNGEKELLSRVNASGKKQYEKLRKEGHLYIYFNSDSTVVALANGSDRLYRLDIATGKIELLSTYADRRTYIPDMHTFISYEDKKGFFIDFVTGKSVQFQSKARYDYTLVSPDKKYVVLTGYYTAFIDRNTGKEVFFTGTGEGVKFSADGSTFYIFSSFSSTGPDIMRVSIYNYPDFTEKKVVEGKWPGPLVPGEKIMFEPNQRLVYTRAGTLLLGRDIETGDTRDTVSLIYTRNASELQAEADEREVNARIGNKALEKLGEMKTPSTFHSLGGQITTSVADYTDDGLVLLYDTYFQGAACILWSFPEGKPLVAFADQASSRNEIPASAIVVPGWISGALLSQSGKLVGLSTTEGVLIYEGNVLKTKIPNHALVALLDDKAMVRAFGDWGKVKDFAMVSTETGKVLNKIKSKPTNAGGDVRQMPGKIFFDFRDEIGVLDLNNPAEVKYIPNAQVTGPERYAANARFVRDRVSGNEEVIAGFGPLASGDKSTNRSGYVINSYANEGFKVYDIGARKMLKDKAVFAGWINYQLVVYFKKLNKLLVMAEVPKYTWPNAKDEDPGASAYTLDLNTAEVTPYLLTDKRAAYVKLTQQWEKEYYAYVAMSDCERNTQARWFKPGNYLWSSSASPSIVVGYDCERQSYVVARRQLLHPGSNSTVQVSRLFEVTESELKSQGYSVSSNTYHICPACQGYPAGSVTEYYSGWSDWEQKSLNIYLYTRKWETKAVQMQVLCKVCKGEAWVK